MDKIKILFFAANPMRDLNLDEEVHKIQEKLEKLRTSQLHSLELVPALAVRRSELIDKLNRHNPNIVHFSGHGSRQGMGVGGTRDLVPAGEEVGNQIYFLDDDGKTAKPVSQDTLVDLFRACKNNIWLAFFNACYTDPLAEALTQGEVVNFAIGMNAAIGDEAARVFAAQFYGSLGDGLSVELAFEQARIQLRLQEISEEKTPKLHVRPTLNHWKKSDAKLPFRSNQSFVEIVDAIENGILVPVLGPSINPAIYIDLAARLVGLLAGVEYLSLSEQQQKDFIKTFYGSTCSICYFLPTLRPESCPVLAGVPRDPPCSIYNEQMLSVAKTNCRSLSQLYELEQGHANLYAKIKRCIINASTTVNQIHLVLARLLKDWRELSAAREPDQVRGGEPSQRPALAFPLIITSNCDAGLEREFENAGIPYDLVWCVAEGNNCRKWMYMPYDGKPRRARGRKAPVTRHDVSREIATPSFARSQLSNDIIKLCFNRIAQ